RNVPMVLAPWSETQVESSAEAIHEVDMEVTIMLDNGTSAVVSWAMDGLVESIDLALRPSHPGKCPVIGRSQQMGPHVLQVPIHPGDRLLPDRHHAVLLPLAP